MLRCRPVNVRRSAPYVAVASVAVGLYLPTLWFGFVLDDKHLIVDNTFVREAWSPLRAFAHHFWYGSSARGRCSRPPVNSSLGRNSRPPRLAPVGFRLGN